MKNFILISLLLIITNVYAYSSDSSSSNLPLNSPTVGGRQQGSNQQFGNPQNMTSGNNGQNKNNGPANSPTVGSRQQGSNQQFGNPQNMKPGNGGVGSTAKNGGPLNSPTVGGRQQSSNQLFNGQSTSGNGQY